jgi:hypothetical protein
MVGSEGICGSQDELKMKLEIFFVSVDCLVLSIRAEKLGFRLVIFKIN